MSPRLRFASLSLWLVGCAAPMAVVSTSEWEIVPPAQRAAVDRESDAELAAARADIATASKSLAELPAASGPASPPPAATSAPTTAAARTADPNARALNDHERTRATARARVETARTTVALADRAWRQHRLDAAKARVTVVGAQRELRRAQAIDRNLLGSDTYETAPLRGQLAQTQRTWYAAYTRAQRARAELDRAAAELAAAKEAYAQIMLRIPGRPDLEVARVAPTTPPPPLVLPAWAVNRADIRRRRGLRRFLDEVATAPPRLKPATFKLSPLPPRPATTIAAPAASPTPAVSASASVTATAAAVPAKAPKPAKPTPPAPKAWDSAELSSGPPIVGTSPTRGSTNTIASSSPANTRAMPAPGAKPTPPAPVLKPTPPAPAPAPVAKQAPPPALAPIAKQAPPTAAIAKSAAPSPTPAVAKPVPPAPAKSVTPVPAAPAAAAKPVEPAR